MSVTIRRAPTTFSKVITPVYVIGYKCRIQTSTPSFLTHLQNATVDSMADSQRIRRGVEIRHPKKKCIKTCIDRYDNGAYSRLQFLRAISHSLGAHTEAFQFASNDDIHTYIHIHNSCLEWPNVYKKLLNHYKGGV